ATFGKISVEPNGVNAIPSLVRGWLDSRAADQHPARRSPGRTLTPSGGHPAGCSPRQALTRSGS
ncbi:hypothetical protein, partial [Streptomyces sp. NPDC048551]|uniref:hypothetical protein n=1 Tax=Streptomyces sp. NPDC048551 TaxID=3155758 RepID=UPI003446F1CB